MFRSNSVLRPLAEVYASSDAEAACTRAFVWACSEVMDADHFDLG